MADSAAARGMNASIQPAALSEAELVPDPEATRLVPRAMAARYGMIPISIEGNRMRVAMRNPRDIEALDYLQLIAHKTPEPIAVSDEAIKSLLPRAYGSGIAPSNESAESLAEEACKTADRADRSDQTVAEMPIVRLFDTLLSEAVRRRATDLHLHPRAGDLLVRMRVDGILGTVHKLPALVGPPLVTRVKILAMLDISERRLPQDGNISVMVGSHLVDLRVSTMLTIHGESVVMRILDHTREIASLDGLGIDGDHARRIESLVQAPNGIILLTGPTGSGKTTTLYACLRLMDHETRNIITLEDPVEYRLPGIRQSQILEKAGITFGSGLRAILRQDPDVILVGEMRDQETVQIALRAALTGHLVLSTLHTNDAVGAVARLREMGVEPYLLASSLLAVGAQRLARRVCPECSTMRAATAAEKRFLGCPDAGAVEVPQANGCPGCLGTGYRGRFAVLELLVPDLGLRAAIATGKPDNELTQQARAEGFSTLREIMASRVLSGWSTVEEMARVIVQEDRG